MPRLHAATSLTVKGSVMAFDALRQQFGGALVDLF
jgi:hypothetical protein